MGYQSLKPQLSSILKLQTSKDYFVRKQLKLRTRRPHLRKNATIVLAFIVQTLFRKAVRKICRLSPAWNILLLKDTFEHMVRGSRNKKM